MAFRAHGYLQNYTRQLKVGLKLKRKHKRPYGKHNAAARLKQRYRRARHVDHSPRMLKEAETLNYLMHQLLKTADSSEGKPYHYHPRHHSKDPEYVYSNPAMQEFKRGFPAPDTHHWRPQGPSMSPHLDNY